MKKCKTFFGTTINKIENEINNFLLENEKIEILFVSHSQSDKGEASWTNYSAIIFYEYEIPYPKA